MRNKIIVSALVVLFLAAVSAAAFAQGVPKVKVTDKDPQALFVEKTFNLGDVLEGLDYTHTFVVKNVGKTELQILSVRPG